MIINTLKTFLIGSSYFFNKFNDFNPKDKDYIVITDQLLNKVNLISYIRLKNFDYLVIWKYIIAKELIEYSKYYL